jgi:hypothetical protein
MTFFDDMSVPFRGTSAPELGRSGAGIAEFAQTLASADDSIPAAAGDLVPAWGNSRGPNRHPPR